MFIISIGITVAMDLGVSILLSNSRGTVFKLPHLWDKGNNSQTLSSTHTYVHAHTHKHMTFLLKFTVVFYILYIKWSSRGKHILENNEALYPFYFSSYIKINSPFIRSVFILSQLPQVI